MRQSLFMKMLTISAITMAGLVFLSPTSADAQTFQRSLTIGSTGDDVKSLQKFLNDHGFTVSSSGVGSPGHESLYFGALTRSALTAFQIANNISPAAGFFGSVTRSRVTAIISSAVAAPETKPSVASAAPETAPTSPVIQTAPVVPALVTAPSLLALSTPDIGVITVSWKKGSADTVIRRAVGTAPATLSDGVEVYKGNKESFEDEALPSGGTVCYSVWGYDAVANTYSAEHIGKCVTLFVSGSAGSSLLPITVASGMDSLNIGNISMDLSFTKGTVSTNTIVRRAVGTAPSQTDAGTLVYSGTGTSFADSGLSPDTNYCYSAWGYDSVTDRYSGTYASLCTTTDDASLIVYWTLNEASGATAADSSSNGNNGTWSDSGSHSTTGKVGNAASFTGTNYVDIDTALFNGATSFTVSYWIKPDFTGDMDTSFCVETAGTSWRLCTFGDSVRLRDNDGFTHDIDLFPVGDLTAGTWYNIAYVYNGAASQFIPYVNGVSVGTTSVGTAMQNDIGSARIGASLDPGYEFHGAMDDFRFFTDALSPSEVNSIYQSSL